MLLRTVFMIGLTLLLYVAGSVAMDIRHSKPQAIADAPPQLTAPSPAPAAPQVVDVLDAPQPTVLAAATPTDLEAAQERLNRVIETGVITDAQPTDVSPRVAALSAAFAGLLRQQTGAVPEGRTPVSERLVIPSSDRFKPVTDRYYAVWDDLMRRCWDSVSNNTPFDDTGLTTHGDQRIDYDTAGTEQKWFTTDKAFEVSYKLHRAFVTPSGMQRICSISTNRFALVEADAVALLKDHYDAWFLEEGLQDVSTFEEYPYEIREGDQYHRVKTDFGSAQGCELIVQYKDIGIIGERDASFYLMESDNEGCEASPRRDGNGVQINRLPQVDP